VPPSHHLYQEVFRNQWVHAAFSNNRENVLGPRDETAIYEFGKNFLPMAWKPRPRQEVKKVKAPKKKKPVGFHAGRQKPKKKKKGHRRTVF